MVEGVIKHQLDQGGMIENLTELLRVQLDDEGVTLEKTFSLRT